MIRLLTLLKAAMVFTLSAAHLVAQDVPRPIPTTRPAMKALIEDVKVRTPRIPLPELTDADREALGERADSYESRLRYHYLNGIAEPRGARTSTTGAQPGRNVEESRSVDRSRRGRREQDPQNSLDNAFKVELFWIVSRTNNCQYCLGHQESKLLAAGLTEDRIAALDTDWTQFTAAENVAYAFSRKFTLEPHLLNDDDIAGLKQHYSEMQILEMILSMAGNNSINRWKEGVGVPQRSDEGGYSRVEQTADGTPAVEGRSRGTYLTPTSVEFANKVSIVAPLEVDPDTSAATTATVCHRPSLETRAQVDAILAACRTRNPRLPLVEESEARRIMADNWTAAEPLPNWVRLLANFPVAGVSRARGYKSAWTKGDLSPLLKAQMSWIIARQDRAWYAAGLAQKQLLNLGQTQSQIDELDGDWNAFPPRERSLFVVARNLAASPVVLTDSEVANAVTQAGPRDVVQVVSYTTSQASFDRVTEAAGLPLE